MNTKKILLSLGFIAVLGIYIVYQRASSNNNPILNNGQSSSVLPSGGQNQTTNQSQTTNQPVAISGYKDGQYTGSSVNVFYGQVQVQAVISGGKIVDIKFLNYPQDNRNSLSRSNSALPQLKSEAIQAQSANVNAVSGATQTSSGFVQSLSSALSQAS